MRTIHQRLAASVAVVAASLVLASAAAAAGVAPSALHPDDRADRTLPPGTLYAGPLDRIGTAPDDGADRGLPRAGLTEQAPGASDAFDWEDAGLGAAAALGVVIVAAGGAAGGLRRRRPAGAV